MSEVSKRLTFAVNDELAVPDKASDNIAGATNIPIADPETPIISTTVATGRDVLTCLIDPNQSVSTIKKDSIPVNSTTYSDLLGNPTIDVTNQDGTHPVSFTWSMVSLAFVELGADFPSFEHKFFHDDDIKDSHSLVVGKDLLERNGIDLWNQGDGVVFATCGEKAGIFCETEE